MSSVSIRHHIKRLGAFGASVAITTLVGLLTIPTIIAVVGATSWGILVIGQSIALLLGVLISFGWGTTGPAMVAALPPSARPQFYMDSFMSRLYLFGVAIPIAAVVVALIASEHWLLVGVACVTYLIPFLGASWYFVGDSQPKRLLLYDTLPIAGGALLGLGSMILTNNMFAYIVCQLVANCVSVLLSLRKVQSTNLPATRPHLDPHIGRAVRRLGGQRHGVITAATSSLYVNTPLLVLAAVAPVGVPAYALADRFFKYGLTVLGPVVQVLQGSIPHPDASVRNYRVGIVARLAPVSGLAAAAVAAVVIPPASHLLSTGQIVIGFDLSVPIALVFGGVATSQAIGLACLIPIGQGRALATSTVLGALLGIPLILIGATYAGAVGVAWAVALSEIAVAAYQVVVVLVFLRRTANG